MENSGLKNTKKKMNKIRLYFILLFMCITLTSCGSCDKPPVVEPNGNTNTNTETQTKDTVPDWMIVDSSFIKDCVTISSKNMIMDTTSMFNVFPFVVKDTMGQSGLFAIVSLKRYDMLYIGQLAIMDDNDYSVSAGFITKLQVKDHFESMLFVFEEVEVNALLKMKESFKFNAWGLFGSVQIPLDSVQSQNLIELAKIVYND